MLFLYFQMYFSVDLDSIYQNNPNSPLYKLSTVDPLRRNTFILIIRLSSTNLNRDQYFTSPSFLIRSRRPAKGSDKNGVENKELLIVDH